MTSLYVSRERGVKWNPPPNFVNFKRTIELLNAELKEFNLKSDVKYFMGHLVGLRIQKETQVKSHRPSQEIWMERAIRNRYHLSRKEQGKYLGHIINIFTRGLKLD